MPGTHAEVWCGVHFADHQSYLSTHALFVEALVAARASLQIQHKYDKHQIHWALVALSHGCFPPARLCFTWLGAQTAWVLRRRRCLGCGAALTTTAAASCLSAPSSRAKQARCCRPLPSKWRGAEAHRCCSGQQALSAIQLLLIDEHTSCSINEIPVLRIH